MPLNNLLIFGGRSFIVKNFIELFSKNYDKCYLLVSEKTQQHHPSNCVYITPLDNLIPSLLSDGNKWTIIYAKSSTHPRVANTYSLYQQGIHSFTKDISSITQNLNTFTLVYLSSFGAFNYPEFSQDNHYLKEKSFCESYLKEISTDRISTISTRISNPFGKQKRIDDKGFINTVIYKHLISEPITIYQDTSIDFIYVEDVAKGIYQSILHASFNNIQHLNVDLAYGQQHRLSQIKNLVESILQFEKNQHCTSHIAQPRQLLRNSKQAFKWIATTPLKDGIISTADWMKSQRPRTQ